MPDLGEKVFPERLPDRKAAERLLWACNEMIRRISEHANWASSINGLIRDAAAAAKKLRFANPPIQPLHYDRDKHDVYPRRVDSYAIEVEPCSAPILHGSTKPRFLHAFGFRLFDPVGGANTNEVMLCAIAEQADPTQAASYDPWANDPTAEEKRKVVVDYLERWVRVITHLIGSEEAGAASKPDPHDTVSAESNRPLDIAPMHDLALEELGAPVMRLVDDVGDYTGTSKSSPMLWWNRCIMLRRLKGDIRTDFNKLRTSRRQRMYTAWVLYLIDSSIASGTRTVGTGCTDIDEMFETVEGLHALTPKELCTYLGTWPEPIRNTVLDYAEIARDALTRGEYADRDIRDAFVKLASKLTPRSAAILKAGGIGKRLQAFVRWASAGEQPPIPPNGPAGSLLASPATKIEKRRRGRLPDTDAAADKKLRDDWKAAKANGTRTIAEFARDRGLDESDVKAAIHRDEVRGSPKGVK